MKRQGYQGLGYQYRSIGQDDDQFPVFGQYYPPRRQNPENIYSIYQRLTMRERVNPRSLLSNQGFMMKPSIGSTHIKSKPSERPFQKPKKKPRKQINKDYTFKGDLIEANQLFAQGDCKKLKKLCANIVNQAQNILIKYSKTKPTLLFQYQQGADRKQIHFRDVVRGNKQKKIMVDYQLILSAFDKLYDKVSDQYFPIGKFAIILGAQKKLFKFKSIDIDKDKKDLRFYYSRGHIKGLVNFILFNKDLFYIQFSSNYIENKKLEAPESYKIYEQFKQKVVPTGNDDDDLIAGQEIESDGEGEQEEEQQQQESKQTVITNELNQVKQKMKLILSRNIANQQTSLEAKNQQCEGLKGSEANREKLEKLSEQVGEMHDNIQNFKQMKEECQIFLLRNNIKNDEQNLHAHKMYHKKLILAERQLVSKLPVLNKKREIFSYLNKHNLLIVEGETGSGKSTQLPQLLCEYFRVFQKENALPILITQPRKLATRSLAERVAFQMDQKLGQFVQYQSSYNNRKINQNAKIYFKLDRLLLDQLTIDPKLSKYQCLVIDEAHERTISIDVILGRVKEILRQRKDFKVIVTSASLDTELFKQYFSAPILKISGRMYPVVEIFKPYDYVKDTKQKIQKLILQQLIEPDLSKPKKQYDGHILVFCSGIDEITALMNTFQRKLPTNCFKVLALHGRMTGEEQSQAFRQSKVHKIIFATRIAETSITINGIKVVIDPGFDRQMIYDQKSKITSMQLRVISESSAKQRAGRAGRTNNGFCFRLYDQQEKRKMQSNKTPQIQNMSLDSVVLRLKSLQIDDVLTFPYLSKPDPVGLKMSVQTMKTIGCLDEKQKITEIGQLLVKIPIEPFLSRAIVESIFYEIVLSGDKIWDEMKFQSEQEVEKIKQINLIHVCTRILAMLINSSSLFIVKENEREDAEKNKFNQFPNLSGDFYLFQCIYSKFITLYSERRNQELRMWANQNYLSLKALHQAREIESEIETIVRKFAFDQKYFKKQLAHVQNSLKSISKADDVIMACLMSSFVTNICLFSGNQQIGYTLMSQSMPVSLYGTTILSLQGNSPKWIVCYDLYTNQNNQTFCKVAQSIEFDFVKKTVRKEVFELFNLEAAEKANPFYQNIVINVPSIEFLHILNDYRRKDSQVELNFLNNFNFFFNEIKNEISIFYLISKFKELKQCQEDNETIKLLRQKENDYRLSKNPKEIIEGYRTEVKSSFKKTFKMDYVGQISIEMTDGSAITDVNFKKSTYSIKLVCNNEMILDLALKLCQEKYQRYPKKLIFQIEGEGNRENFKKKIKLLQQYFKQKRRYSFLYFQSDSDYEIKLYEQVIDTRHKIPKGKLVLNFYAGISNNPTHTFLNYKKYEDRTLQKNYISGIKQIFQQRSLLLFKELPLKKLTVSKNLSGLNIYTYEALDQIEVMEILTKLDRRNALGFGFQLPQGIIKYREPERPMCDYTNMQWEEKIRELIRKAKIEAEDITVKIWGTYKRDNQEGILSEYEKRMRVNMSAQIESFSLNALEQFQKRYNKSNNILGYGKLHIKFEFAQTVAATTSDIFMSLEEDFHQLVRQCKIKYPNLSIQASNPIRFRSAYKIFINVKGNNRAEFSLPSKKINQLFRPKQIKIEPMYWYLFDRYSNNNKDSILNRLEQKQHYNVYFIFEKKTLTLKVFCHSSRFAGIKEEIQNEIKTLTLKTQFISYRGKGLKAIQNFIKEIKEKIQLQGANKQSKSIAYEINYQKRELEVTGDFLSLAELKQKINKLQNIEAEVCKLCEEVMHQPYQLFNCNDSFCMLCLFNTIKQTVSTKICCPQCSVDINIYDIKTILTQEEFFKVCDRQVAKFVEKSQELHSCFSPDCEQIFSVEQSKINGSFQCQLCGKWYCFECKRQHKGFTCKDQIDSQTLNKLGIKKCPKCGFGIEKNKGCNHMTCFKCQAHICWKCLKCFQTQKQCYDHLAKVCGGIFDPGYND